MAKPFGSSGADSYVLWYQNGELHGSIGANLDHIDFPWTPLPNRWYDVAFTFDDCLAHVPKLYIDGSQVATATAATSTTLVYDSQAVLIGADNDGGGNLLLQFDGLIDTVRIWNSAESPTQITANLKGILPAGTCTGMLAQWTFSEETGLTTNDSSGNGNGGSLGGGTAADSPAWNSENAPSVVNHSPIGTSKTVTVLEDAAYVFKATDFGFTDPKDTPANTLLAVKKITTLPALGSLADNGVAVAVGAHVPAADITAGKLKPIPSLRRTAMATYSSFTFQVQDNGGTANGGVDTDPTPRKMSISVTPVNDAPVGTPKTVTTLEDTAYVLKVADFGFSDPKDSPANILLW